MFDLGWMELLVIGVVALIVVGPKDLPVMFKTVGNFDLDIINEKEDLIKDLLVINTDVLHGTIHKK